MMNEVAICIYPFDHSFTQQMFTDHLAYITHNSLF